MEWKQRLRIGFAAVAILLLVAVSYGYATGVSESTFDENLEGDSVADPQKQIAPQSDNITVIATDSNTRLGKRSDGPRARSELIAFAENGSTLYYNDSHTRYWDIDPVPGTETTVEYLFSDHLTESECPTDWNTSRRSVSNETWEEYEEARSSKSVCTRNGIERVNLTTGEVTRVWDEVTPGKGETRSHDADRLNETHFVVADIYLDRIFTVNTSSDRTEWTWNASSAFPKDSGGPYPEDWTHINDVEALDDGRFMVSTRNQDRIVFVEPGNGIQEEWTLGEEDNYNILYEQHNPDYIPEKNGGPAVIVADSENNRVVEYQRENGEWKQTWIWSDARVQWPRDADRLPNGNTLITDSNGNRVFEVNENGDVVWSVNVAFPYESERLGTGDESTNGPSTERANIESKDGGVGDQFWVTVKQFLPGKYLNALMYVTPVWMGMIDLFTLVGLLCVGIVWTGFEFKWRR